MIKRIFKSIVIFLVLLCPTAANGSDISSASYRVPLEVEELGKAYQFTLPEGAYEKIAREDFLDVTIVDSAGSTPPFITTHETQKTETREEVSLPFYAIYATESIPQEEMSLNIEQGKNRITLKTRNAQGGGEKIVGYLLDLRALENKPQELLFHWAPQKTPFVASIHFSTSPTLSNWQALPDQGTLAELHHEGRTLKENFVPLSSPLSAKYVLITWEAGQKIPPMTAVKGVAYRSGIPTYASKVLQGKHLPDAARGEFVYDLGGIYPLQALDLLAQNSFFPQTKVSARSQEADAWQFLFAQDFYRVALSGQKLTNQPVPLSGSNQRYWKVLIKDSLAPSQAPDLKFFWLPIQVRFLAQGVPPFFLEFGGNEAHPQDAGQQFFSLLSSTKETPLLEARLGSIQKHSTQAEPAPEETKNWGQFVLPVLLLLAVSLLCIMAWKLSSSMKQNTR